MPDSNSSTPSAQPARAIAEAPAFFRTLSSPALFAVGALVLLFLFGMGYILLGSLRKNAVAQTDTRPLQPLGENQLAGQIQALEAQAKQLQQRQKALDAKLPPAFRPESGADSSAPNPFVIAPPPPNANLYSTPYAPAGAGYPDSASGGSQRSAASGPSPLTKARSAPLLPQSFRPSNPPTGEEREPRAPSFGRSPSEGLPPFPDPVTLADSILRRVSPASDPAQTTAVASDAASEQQGFLKAATEHQAVAHVQRLHPLPSPYTLLQGTVLPAVLESSLNSDLPGQTSALLRRNVYDSATGQSLLLPRGARLVGSYDSRIVFGQRRVLVAWDRLLLPSGDTIDLHGMPGVDGLRAAGLTDQVNNHFLQVFGNALLLSAISAGAQLSQPQQANSSSVPSASQVAAAAVGQELSQVATAVINRQLNVQPTLRVRPGYEFNVELTADLVFDRPPTSDVRADR